MWVSVGEGLVRSFPLRWIAAVTGTVKPTALAGVAVLGVEAAVLQQEQRP